ncbi:MAG: Porin [Hydrocarboniphaga sp.]|uniref:porin n=1 Tax=Hydrocarboniphaga sp. TaxID=2033016 RepID=UPI0026173624|nr:porin [Hydrocarboniphaga sp.]MDB5969209.1 Porin [Hydrocarboniphaga sp.]
MQMQNKRRGICLAAASAALISSTAAQAIDIQAGDWKFTVNGNVNVHYIYSSCDDSPSVVTGGLACTAGGDTSKSTSSISNGLLPAALTFGAATTQQGYDIEAHFGLYPGIATNDGGSPNLQQDGGGAGTNTALGTTGLDVRQVYMTFGNKQMGTFMLGRNFGLFGFDAIINDMTLPGVGVAGGSSSGSPANTTLGSIGLGYIYVDTLAQMNYTTPDFAGFKLTAGIFEPVNPAGSASTPKSSPGFHGKVAYTAGPVYLSATAITQKQEGVTNASDFTSTGFDAGGKLTFGPAELMAYYYAGSGLGTTGLFINGSDGAGDKRDSDGFIAQATYKLGDTKLGVNYGESNLDLADGEASSSLVEKNSKYTLGVYHSLTKNLTLLAEFSDVKAQAHNGAENKSSNFNVGAFMSF